jgi:hypothetical protein
MRTQVIGWSVFEGASLMGPLFIDAGGNLFFLNKDTRQFMRVEQQHTVYCEIYRNR